MTSTISSNNKNFRKLLQWTLERNKRTIIAFSVILAIVLMIGIHRLIILSTAKNGINSMSNSICNSMMIIAQAFSVLFTIISVSRTFSFIHNKRSTDMFGALPATRGTLYFSHLLGGIASVSLPYISFCIISLAVFQNYGKELIINILLILAGLLSIAAVYSFSALIAYCCGTVRDSVIVNLAVNGIYFGVLILFSGTASSIIPGLRLASVGNNPIYTLLSPILFCGYFDIFIFSEMVTEIVTMFVWSVIYTAAAVFLGNYAAKTRKAETAQNEFNIKWLPVVIKSGVSVLCGSFAGLIVASSSSAGFTNMLVFVFWYIVIGFASMLILHLILSKDNKGKFKTTLIAYLFTTIGVIGIFFAMSTGLGLDTYIPDDSNISSVTFSGTTYTEPENIKTITEIHRTVIEGVKKDHPRPYYLGSSVNYGYNNNFQDTEEYLRMTNYEFKYNKKIGFTTLRNYYTSDFSSCDLNKLEQLLKTLYNSEEYKRKSAAFIFASDDTGIYNNPSKAAIVLYFKKNSYTSSYDNIDSAKIETDEEFLKELSEALRTDILNDDNYYEYEYITHYYAFNDNKLSTEKYIYIDVNGKLIFIPEEYTNTTKYIKDYLLINYNKLWI